MACPLYPSFLSTPSSAMVVSRDEFNAFHKIDRTLFTRLVYNLNRDMDQSFRAMAFLMLLEQSGYARHIIAYLVSLPDAFIDAVANEITVCVSLLYNLDFASTFFASPNNDDNSIIPLLLRLTGGSLTLTMVDQNREVFSGAMAKNCSDTCTRAFEDICENVQRYNREKLVALEREKLLEGLKKLRLGIQQENSNRLSGQQVTSASPPPRPPVGDRHKAQKEKEIAEEEEKKVAADDRTVFLTFSKGYPISEEEVRVFITRRFGDVIEAIEMQEVEGNEQPLFAKMILKLRCASMMEEIVSVRTRNKFTINGKHVWARKYVRKNFFSASSSTHHI